MTLQATGEDAARSIRGAMVRDMVKQPAKVQVAAAHRLLRKAESPVFHVPHSEAGFCLDCEAVFRLAQACPACSSRSVASLAKLMSPGSRA